MHKQSYSLFWEMKGDSVCTTPIRACVQETPPRSAQGTSHSASARDWQHTMQASYLLLQPTRPIHFY